MDIHTISIGELVISNSKLKQVFKSFGINYYCNGDLALEEAIVGKNIDLTTILTCIEQIEMQKTCFTSLNDSLWLEKNLITLIDYIENTHHVFMKRILPRLEVMFKDILQIKTQGNNDDTIYAK